MPKNDGNKAYMITVVWAARGSDIFFGYSYSSRTPLDSSRLGEQNYAISKRLQVKSKNNSFQKGKFNEKLPLREERGSHG